MDFIRELTDEVKEELVQMVVGLYSDDPSRLRTALPEVADLLDASSSLGSPPRENPDPIGLTRQERDFHRQALEEILGKPRSLTAEQAIKGLEHGAILLYDNRDRYEPMSQVREELLKLVRKSTGIRPRKTGKPVEKVVREGEASRIVPAVAGLDLHLTRDFKLLKVTMNPEKWRLRCQALSVVGIGRDRDGATDVSVNHDDYFVDAILNG